MNKFIISTFFLYTLTSGIFASEEPKMIRFIQNLQYAREMAQKALTQDIIPSDEKETTIKFVEALRLSIIAAERSITVEEYLQTAEHQNTKKISGEIQNIRALHEEALRQEALRQEALRQKIAREKFMKTAEAKAMLAFLARDFARSEFEAPSTPGATFTPASAASSSALPVSTSAAIVSADRIVSAKSPLADKLEATEPEESARKKSKKE